MVKAHLVTIGILMALLAAMATLVFAPAWLLALVVFAVMYAGLYKFTREALRGNPKID